MLKVVLLADGGLTVDFRRRLPGRGAWLHPDASCWDPAIHRKGLNRAFRGPVDTVRMEQQLKEFERTTQSESRIET
ncbi:YlxR family protein [Psychromicrobium xiongbiense]|uniref:YlxR family protein n=1 Tax=Psychromicrobium xiongbiense TaxID=3051184 RepID=UPI0025532648|nr:YlxR family protein [Psychromicrobium sp. YIM S02556]